MEKNGTTVLVCPRCAPTENRTCQACHRYRRLIQTDDGRWLCTPCAERGLIDCPQCHKPMPAGYGKRCESCYWQQLLIKRIALNQAALSNGEMQTHLDAFGHWLAEEVGVHKAAITINKYLPFFMELDKRWQTVPDYKTLLLHFGAEDLRRVRLPMRWLSSTGHVTVDEKTREKNSDQRRIEATLAKLPADSPQRKILDSYYELLARRHEEGRLSIRSLRLSLTPSLALLQVAADECTDVPRQKQLELLLQRSPGQRAAISGFITYLRDQHDAPLTLPAPDPKQAKKNRLKKLENEIAKLVERPVNKETTDRLWIELALSYFHNLPRKTGRTLARSETIINADNGYWVSFDDKNYYVPTRPTSTLKKND